MHSDDSKGFRRQLSLKWDGSVNPKVVMGPHGELLFQQQSPELRYFLHARMQPTLEYRQVATSAQFPTGRWFAVCGYSVYIQKYEGQPTIAYNIEDHEKKHTIPISPGCLVACLMYHHLVYSCSRSTGGYYLRVVDEAGKELATLEPPPEERIWKYKWQSVCGTESLIAVVDFLGEWLNVFNWKGKFKRARKLQFPMHDSRICMLESMICITSVQTIRLYDVKTLQELRSLSAQDLAVPPSRYIMAVSGCHTANTLGILHAEEEDPDDVQDSLLVINMSISKKGRIVLPSYLLMN